MSDIQTLKLQTSHRRVPWSPLSNIVLKKGATPYKLALPYSQSLGWLIAVDLNQPKDHERPAKNTQRHPQRTGGITTCAIDIDGTEFSGSANCSLSDNFSYKQGRKIALGRAVFSAKQAGFDCWVTTDTHTSEAGVKSRHIVVKYRPGETWLNVAPGTLLSRNGIKAYLAGKNGSEVVQYDRLADLDPWSVA